MRTTLINNTTEFLRRPWQEKIQIFFERGNYRVKTVDHPKELDEVFRLRYEVFHGEYLGKTDPRGRDWDEFDSHCDHLVIMDITTKRIVGTYRLIASNFSSKFYSASEFDIQHLLELPGEKLELGRACVKKEYRDGTVLSLLWRGIVQYALKSGADYLFGCASIKTTDVYEVSLIYKYFRDQNLLSPMIRVDPTPRYAINQLPEFINVIDLKGVGHDPEWIKTKIPSLLETYMKAGAKVCGFPALDPAFLCVDFLTVLKMADLGNVYRRRYQPA